MKFALLSLLNRRPAHGYALKLELDSMTGHVWALNIGQVYLTLSRLERDGLVTASAADDEGRVIYGITSEGRAEIRAWLVQPSALVGSVRDALSLKIALSVATQDPEIDTILAEQRSATLTTIRELTRLKSGEDIGWTLMLEAMRFRADAELRWLDFVHDMLQAQGRRFPKGPQVQAAAGAGTVGVHSR